MPTTAHYAIPTPTYQDPPDGPAAFKAVADALDSALFTESGRLDASYATVQASAASVAAAAAQIPVTAGQQLGLLLMGV